MHLWLCTRCGLYVKGLPASVSEVCGTHMCDGDTNMDIKECQTVLGKLLEAAFSGDATSASVPIPPPPPPPPTPRSEQNKGSNAAKSINKK